jgi:hypothetical protein
MILGNLFTKVLYNVLLGYSYNMQLDGEDVGVVVQGYLCDG